MLVTAVVVGAGLLIMVAMVALLGAEAEVVWQAPPVVEPGLAGK